MGLKIVQSKNRLESLLSGEKVHRRDSVNSVKILKKQELYINVGRQSRIQ